MDFLNRIIEKSADLSSFQVPTAVFLGDSVTQGCFELTRNKDKNIDTVYEQESAYHSLLKKRFPEIFPNVPLNFINSGISGNTAVQGLERLERDVLAYSPHLVIICFGLNDVSGGMDKITDFSQTLNSIFRKLISHGIEVIFMTPNMMNTYVSQLIVDKEIIEIAKGSADLQNNEILDAYIDTARKVCEENKVPVCECYFKWKQMYEAGVDITVLLSNYINHPSRKMHEMFAHDLFEMIMFQRRD